jgi:hypothetical protein
MKKYALAVPPGSFPLGPTVHCWNDIAAMSVPWNERWWQSLLHKKSRIEAANRFKTQIADEFPDKKLDFKSASALARNVLAMLDLELGVDKELRSNFNRVVNRKFFDSVPTPEYLLGRISAATGRSLGINDLSLNSLVSPLPANSLWVSKMGESLMASLAKGTVGIMLPDGADSWKSLVRSTTNLEIRTLEEVDEEEILSSQEEIPYPSATVIGSLIISATCNESALNKAAKLFRTQSVSDVRVTIQGDWSKNLRSWAAIAKRNRIKWRLCGQTVSEAIEKLMSIKGLSALEVSAKPEDGSLFKNLLKRAKLKDVKVWVDFWPALNSERNENILDAVVSSESPVRGARIHFPSQKLAMKELAAFQYLNDELVIENLLWTTHLESPFQVRKLNQFCGYNFLSAGVAKRAPKIAAANAANLTGARAIKSPFSLVQLTTISMPWCYDLEGREIEGLPDIEPQPTLIIYSPISKMITESAYDERLLKAIQARAGEASL